MLLLCSFQNHSVQEKEKRKKTEKKKLKTDRLCFNLLLRAIFKTFKLKTCLLNLESTFCHKILDITVDVICLFSPRFQLLIEVFSSNVNFSSNVRVKD